jgi:capsular exopolysaccharide synthesis family protein
MPTLEQKGLDMETSSDKEMTLRDLAGIYQRRRKIIHAVTLAILLLAGIYCVVSTRRYEASATVEIRKEGADAMGLQEMMSGPADGASDALEGNILIETQAAILRSDSLALKTIQELHLEQTADFKPHWNLMSWFVALISPRGLPDKRGAGLEDSPARRSLAVQVFKKNLTVKPIPGTRLIEIAYLSFEPTVAATVVNRLTQALIDYTFQTRFTATNQASEWLRSQLGDLRKQSEDLQKQVVDLQRASGVYSLGNVDATGREMAYSAVLDSLQQKTQALNQAQKARILRGAIAQAAVGEDAELLSGLAGNAELGSSMSNSLQLLQGLRQQEAVEKASLRELEAKYGPAYPKLNEMQSNLAALNSSISEESSRIKARAASDYEIAKQDESASRAEFNREKSNADKLNDKAIEFAIVRQEAEESRQLYEGLVNKLREAGVLEGLKSSNITIVDPARVPWKPLQPNVPVYMAAALAGGFIIGCGFGLIADTFDNKINSIYDAEQVIGRTLFGVTPDFNHALQIAAERSRWFLPSVDEPRSSYTESLRTIRTSILLAGGGDKSRVILITSAIPGEGKSVLAVNLAVLFAQSNRRVLLVDMDMRRGTLRQRLNQPRRRGLSDLLAGQIKESRILPVENINNLWYMQAGSAPPNPAELLGETLFAEWLAIWRSQYDVVLLDSPPLLPVTDTHIVRPLVDVTLLLARARHTERRQLRRALEMVETGKGAKVGIILNGIHQGDESYYEYHGYKQYAYQRVPGARTHA